MNKLRLLVVPPLQRELPQRGQGFGHAVFVLTRSAQAQALLVVGRAAAMLPLKGGCDAECEQRLELLAGVAQLAAQAQRIVAECQRPGVRAGMDGLRRQTDEGLGKAAPVPHAIEDGQAPRGPGFRQGELTGRPRYVPQAGERPGRAGSIGRYLRDRQASLYRRIASG